MRYGQSYLSSKGINVATNAVSAIATTLTFEWDMSEAAAFSLQTQWGADITGTWALYERTDPDLSWVANTTISFTNPAKSATSKVYDNIGAVSPHWQLRFTYTSGVEGPLYASVFVKEIGA